MIRVSSALKRAFNMESAHLFRLGGDEFSVVFENVDENHEEFGTYIRNKCESINDALKQKGIDVPISLSAGLAFGDDNDTTDSLFKKADIALYHTKNTTRSSLSIFDPSMK